MTRPAADFLARTAGLDAASLGAGALDAAVRTRCATLGLDERGLVARLQSDPEEERAFLARLLVHETWLFRDRLPFELLGAIATRRAATRTGLPFRVLSFPCATGEEAWSIAVTLLDAGLAPSDFLVLACDLEPAALAVATRGVYPRRAFRGTDDMCAARRFEPASLDGVEAAVEPPAAVRRSVEFRRMNLLEAGSLATEGPFDAVFCRNALIYMHPEARRRVIVGLHALLAPDGVLVVGHSEVPTLLAHGFRRHEAPGAFALLAGGAGPTPPSVVASTPPEKPLRSHAAKPARAPLASLPSSATAAGQAPMPEPEPRTQPSKPAFPSLDSAREAADAGRIEEADRLVRAHLEARPASAAAHALLGILHVAARRDHEARVAHERAVYLDPAREEALLHLAALLERAGACAAAERLRVRARRIEAGS